jgi:hypothetical protein
VAVIAVTAFGVASFVEARLAFHVLTCPSLSVKSAEFAAGSSAFYIDIQTDFWPESFKQHVPFKVEKP